MMRDPLKPMPNNEYLEHGGQHCPYCWKSDGVSAGEMQIDSMEAWQNVVCDAEHGGCGKEWTDLYKLTGWKPVE